MSGLADFAICGSDPNEVLRVSQALRTQGITAHVEYAGSVRKQLRRASRHSHNVVNLDNADESALISAITG